jgi:hypothetical protein
MNDLASGEPVSSAVSAVLTSSGDGRKMAEPRDSSRAIACEHADPPATQPLTRHSNLVMVVERLTPHIVWLVSGHWSGKRWNSGSA